MLYTKLFLKIKVVGTDAAGISAVNYMLKKNMAGINFYAFAEDISQAKTLKKHRIFQSDTEKFLTAMSGADLIFIVGEKDFDADILKNSGALVIKIPHKNNFEEFAYKLVKNFVEIFTLPGYPKIGFPKIFEVGGDFISFAEDTTPIDAMKNIVHATEDFSGVKEILFNVTTSARNFSCEDAEEIVNFLSRLAPNAKISFGCSIDDFINGTAKIILIAR